jgi:exopolyphosphatase/guanosine-5'-triphosphate,3'-diphosphate pyrophosphatase
VAERAGELAGMSAAERARLPGVSESRAAQLLSGAIVADAAMDLFEVEDLHICPWALREGVILRRLDQMSGLGLGGISVGATAAIAEPPVHAD